jgi:hypothetical protein
MKRIPWEMGGPRSGERWKLVEGAAEAFGTEV